MDSAFKSANVINNQDQCEQELTKLIYQQQNPLYDRGDNFNAQCHLLIEKYKIMCDDLGVLLENNTEILSRFCLRLQTDYYANQSSLFYASLKKYLEYIYLALQKNTVAYEKKAILDELLPNLLMCGPGVFTHLTETLTKISGTLTLTHLLAEMRRNIILELAAKHCKRKELISANWVHVDNVLLAYAEINGLAPLGGAEHDYLIEIHHENAEINDNDLENFLVDFHLQYQPHTILNSLGHKIEAYYLKLLAQLSDYLKPDKTILLKSPNDYTRIRGIIEHSDHLFVVADLFTADEEDTNLLRLRTPYAALVSMCVRTEIFKHNTLDNKNHNIRYITADPPVLMIDDLAGEVAIEYLYINNMWSHLSLADVKLLQIPLTIKGIKHYLNQGEKDFHQANFSRLITYFITHQDATRLTMFHQLGADLNAPLSDGLLPVELAARLGYWEMVRTLITLVSPQKQYQERYGGILTLAARANQTEIVVTLIQANASPNFIIPSCGNSTLHFAVEHRNTATIAYLVAAKADITLENHQSLTPMTLAAKNNHWDIVSLIAGIRPTDPDDKAGYGSALLSAVRQNEYQSARTLIFAGASPNWHYNSSMKSTLHCAVHNHNNDMLKLLIQANADLSAVDNDNMAPIAYAASLNLWDAVITIASLVSIHGRDEFQYAEALLTAAEENELDALKALIKGGADCNGSMSENGNTALHWAIKHRNKAMVSELLNAKADLKLMNNDDLTPLEFANKIGAIDIATFIQNYGSFAMRFLNFFQANKNDDEKVAPTVSRFQCK